MKEFIIVLACVVVFYFAAVSLHHIVAPVSNAITGGLNG